MKRAAVLLATHFVLAISVANAQTQTTLGRCSPAIAGVGRDVSVTCILKDQRIQIAKYNEWEITNNFVKFLQKNMGRIVRIDTSADADAYRKYAGESYLNVATPEMPAECNTVYECAEQWDIYVNDPGKPSTAYMEHGSWRIRGYYIVKKGGYGQGSSTIILSPVDENQVVLSDKYETE